MVQTVARIRQIIADKIPTGLVVPEHTEDAHYYRYKPLEEVYGSVTRKTGILDAPRLKKWAARLAIEHIDKNWDRITPQNKEEIFEAAVMAHVDYFHDAGEVGTGGHNVVDAYLKSWMGGTKPPDIRDLISVRNDSRVYAITRSAELFCKDFEAYPVASELRIAHPKYKYGGTLDSLMMVRRYVQPAQWSCRFPEHIWGYEVGNPNVAVCPGCATIKEWVFCLVDWKSSNTIDKVEYAMQTSAYWEALNYLTRRNPKLAASGLRPKEILIVKLSKEYAKYEVMRVVDRKETFKMFLHCSKIDEWLHDEKLKLEPLVEKRIITL